MSNKKFNRFLVSPKGSAPVYGLCRILLAWCCPPRRGCGC